MDGGELLERITHSRKLEEHEAKLIFYQIVRGVKYLHDNLICHRDLKVSRRYMYIRGGTQKKPDWLRGALPNRS